MLNTQSAAIVDAIYDEFHTMSDEEKSALFSMIETHLINAKPISSTMSSDGGWGVETVTTKGDKLFKQIVDLDIEERLCFIDLVQSDFLF